MTSGLRSATTTRTRRSADTLASVCDLIFKGFRLFWLQSERSGHCLDLHHDNSAPTVQGCSFPSDMRCRAALSRNACCFDGNDRVRVWPAPSLHGEKTPIARRAFRLKFPCVRATACEADSRCDPVCLCFERRTQNRFPLFKIMV